MADPLLYLSVPVTVDMSCVKSLTGQYLFNDVQFNYWERGSPYVDNWVNFSDGIVIFHPNNEFNFSARSLPFGVHKELKQAIDHKLPVFVGFQRKSDKIWGIYETTLTHTNRIDSTQIYSHARRSNFTKVIRQESIKEKLSALENKVQESTPQPEIAVSAQSNIILLYGA